jgi:hypothetical protein
MAARSITDLGAFWGTWSGSASTEHSISGSRKLKPEAQLKRENRLVGRGGSSTRAAPPASRSWRAPDARPPTGGRSHAGAEPLGKRPRVNFRVGKAAATGSICGRGLEVDARHPRPPLSGEKARRSYARRDASKSVATGDARPRTTGIVERARVDACAGRGDRETNDPPAGLAPAGSHEAAVGLTALTVRLPAGTSEGCRDAGKPALLGRGQRAGLGLQRRRRAWRRGPSALRDRAWRRSRWQSRSSRSTATR